MTPEVTKGVIVSGISTPLFTRCVVVVRSCLGTVTVACPADVKVMDWELLDRDHALLLQLRYLVEPLTVVEMVPGCAETVHEEAREISDVTPSVFEEAA